MKPTRALDGIVTFAEGLPGFEASRRFVLASSPDLEPFTILKGLDEGDPSFLAIDPRRISGDFPNRLEAVERVRLGVAGDEPLLWLAIVAADADGAATANLRAPIVINPATMRGIQIISVDTPYSTAHPLQAA
jgi:flagellar assembly factor FliW